MVVDGGQHRVLTPVDQEHSADDVELPQVHRRFACPPLVDSFMLLLLAIHQTIAHQDAVSRGLRWGLFANFQPQFVGDAPGSPASMVAAHFTDQRFHIGRDPARAGMRATRLIGQTVRAAGLIAFTPSRDCLPRHAEPLGHLTNGRISTVTRAATSESVSGTFGLTTTRLWQARVARQRCPDDERSKMS